MASSCRGAAHEPGYVRCEGSVSNHSGDPYGAFTVCDARERHIAGHRLGPDMRCTTQACPSVVCLARCVVGVLRGEDNPVNQGQSASIASTEAGHRFEPNGQGEGERPDNPSRQWAVTCCALA
jgi:hypothetical protein